MSDFVNKNFKFLNQPLNFVVLENLFFFSLMKKHMEMCLVTFLLIFMLECVVYILWKGLLTCLSPFKPCGGSKFVFESGM